jgi:hypothetical protein
VADQSTLFTVYSNKVILSINPFLVSRQIRYIPSQSTSTRPAFNNQLLYIAGKYMICLLTRPQYTPRLYDNSIDFRCPAIKPNVRACSQEHQVVFGRLSCVFEMSPVCLICFFSGRLYFCHVCLFMYLYDSVYMSYKIARISPVMTVFFRVFLPSPFRHMWAG